MGRKDDVGWVLLAKNVIRDQIFIKKHGSFYILINASFICIIPFFSHQSEEFTENHIKHNSFIHHNSSRSLCFFHYTTIIQLA